MQGPKFKFYIKNTQGLYYFVDELDSVQITGDKKEIQHAPKGWLDMAVGLLRNYKYRANFTKVSTPLQFVKDARKIINYLFFYNGVNANAIFVIEKQIADDFSYQPFFNGTVDFDNYTYGEIFSVTNIKENLLLDILEFKSDVVFEVELNEFNSVDVKMDGINLHYKTDYLVDEGFQSGDYFRQGHTVALVSLSNENPYAKDSGRTKLPNTLNATVLNNTNQYFYGAQTAATLNISYDFSFHLRWNAPGISVGPTASVACFVDKVSASGGRTQYYLLNVTGANNSFGISPESGKTHHLAGNVNIAVVPGDKLFLITRPYSTNNANAEGAITTYEGSTMEFILDSTLRQPATMHKGIYPYKLWEELIKKISNEQYIGISPHLQLNTNLVLIPGSALRKDEKITLQTTIKDFLKYCYVNHLAVLSQAEPPYALLSHIDDTFLNKELMHVGRVANLQVETAKDYNISTIKVGYVNVDIGSDGQINGKDEFNQTNYFTTGQDKIKAEYDIVCPYIASMYAQEILRVKFGELKTTDNNKDNKVFILDSEIYPDTLILYTGTYTVTSATSVVLPIPFGLAIGTLVTLTGANAGVYVVFNSSPEIGGTGTVLIFTTPLPVSSGAFTSTFSYSTNVLKPRRPVYNSVSGILDPASAYNIEISPTHILLAHQKIISGGIYNSGSSTEMDTVKFQSGDKNVELSVSLDGVNFITENANKLISTFDTPYYVPMVFAIDTDYVQDLFALLQGENKYKYISFDWGDYTFSGYIIDVESNPDNNKKQRWKLLCHISSNILNLI